MLQGISPARLPAASQRTAHHVREPTWPPSLGKPSDDKHLTATHTGAIPLTPSRLLTHRQGWSGTVYGLTCSAGYDTASHLDSERQAMAVSANSDAAVGPQSAGIGLLLSTVWRPWGVPDPPSGCTEEFRLCRAWFLSILWEIACLTSRSRKSE